METTIKPYQIYRFKLHLSNRFYRASINRLFLIDYSLLTKTITSIYRFPQEFDVHHCLTRLTCIYVDLEPFLAPQSKDLRHTPRRKKSTTRTPSPSRPRSAQKWNLTRAAGLFPPASTLTLHPLADRTRQQCSRVCRWGCSSSGSGAASSACTRSTWTSSKQITSFESKS